MAGGCHKRRQVHQHFPVDYANAQMSAQQSLFTFAGQLGDDHDVALARSLPESWQNLKVIVPKQEKQRLRKRLFLMNVAPLNLFPNVDGVGLHIHEAIESGFDLGGEGLVGRLEDRIRERTITWSRHPRRMRRNRPSTISPPIFGEPSCLICLQQRYQEI
jgi:hypothetical protein